MTTIAQDSNWILPSRNVVASGISLHEVLPSDRMIEIAKSHNLVPPDTQQTVSQSPGHCVAMSLHFLKTVQITQANDLLEKVKTAAKILNISSGANKECVRTTNFYTSLFDANEANIKDELQFKSQIRSATANAVGLTTCKNIQLEMSVQDMLNHFIGNLADGSYLIPMTGHVMAMVKQDGKVYFYDPNKGIIELNESTKPKVETILNKYKVYLTETLTLVQLKEGSAPIPVENESVISIEYPPSLTYITGSSRFRHAIFEWRGKTYDFVYDTINGQIYNLDSKALLRFKFFLLTFGRVLIDTTLRVIYHTALFIIRILGVAYLKLSCQSKKMGYYELKLSAIQSFYDIFRATFYGIGLFFVSAYGLANPYNGRRLYGVLERTLNRQETGVNFKQKYYTSPCFTPLNLKKAKNDIEYLKDFVRKTEFAGSQQRKVFELFFGWRRSLGFK